MQHISNGFQQTAPAAQWCPGFSPKRSVRLEYEAPEESKIRDFENQISDARRKGMPVEPLIEKRRQTYESWLERLQREIEKASGSDRQRLQRQRERAIRDYAT